MASKVFGACKVLLISCVFSLMGFSEALACSGGSSSFHVIQSFYADYQLVPRLFKIRTKEIYVEISYAVAGSKPKELYNIKQRTSRLINTEGDCLPGPLL